MTAFPRTRIAGSSRRPRRGASSATTSRTATTPLAESGSAGARRSHDCAERRPGTFQPPGRKHLLDRQLAARLRGFLHEVQLENAVLVPGPAGRLVDFDRQREAAVDASEVAFAAQ